MDLRKKGKKMKKLRKFKISSRQAFFFVWCCFAFALFFHYYEGRVHAINATMFAFSYKYGFISRGLIGTIYALIDKVTPWDGVDYLWVLRFNQVVTLLFFMLLAGFVVMCIRKTKDGMDKYTQYVILFYTIFAVPFFSSHYNFGRLDIYCLMFSIIAAILIVKEKMVWLCVPLSALGVMVHQGNVFMYLNIILVLLLYKAMTKEGTERRKYIILLVLSFVTASVLFLYFELFSHFNGDNIYDEIITNATLMCNNGEIHQDVIDHEILGVDLTQKEVQYHLMNAVQFPIFVILMLPIIGVVASIFRFAVKNAENKLDKWKYLALASGSLTILPDLLLKVDFGRWMFAIISYYAVVILSTLAMNDSHMERQIVSVFRRIKQKNVILAPVMLLYPLLFQPLMDVSICQVTAWIAGQINNLMLHWW